MCIIWILTFSFNKWLHEVLIYDKRHTFQIDKLQDIWRFVFKLKRPSLNDIQIKIGDDIINVLSLRYLYCSQKTDALVRLRRSRIPYLAVTYIKLILLRLMLRSKHCLHYGSYTLLIPAIIKDKRSSISKENLCC